MPELRHDPIQRRWVIIATERARRPSDFSVNNPHGKSDKCPFCEGKESLTPPEIFAIRHSGGPNEPGWDVRVIPNKFPALRIEGELGRAAAGMYDKMNGIGAHEVIVESPEHVFDISDLPVEHITLILKTYRERINDLRKDPRFRYILVFRNHGAAAGASLSHPHSQIIATPVTPRTVAVELESAKDHYALKERCIFCDIIVQELQTRSRLVSADEKFLTFCPYASRFPFEMTIIPRHHSHDFALESDDNLASLARHMKEVLLRMRKALNDPPYNLVFHTAPAYQLQTRRVGYWATIEQDWHWHIEVLPRLTKQAGFEWGTGFYINPTPPEDAARFMRETEI